jgi:hypothetical protein
MDRKRADRRSRAGRESGERERLAALSLGAMERALAEEAAAIMLSLRAAGVEVDALTLVVLLVVEACVDGDLEPLCVVRSLADHGSLASAVAIVERHVARQAA